MVVLVLWGSCVTALKPGTVLGNHRYELVSCLGKGGQAQVWEARQGGIGGFSKVVVLKILEFDATREKQRSLLLHEARIVSQLQHPNLVSIFDVDEVPPYLYIAMEYVEGYDIEDFMAHVIASVGRRSLPWQVALTIFRQVCRGLHHAHTATDALGQSFRLIHRDLKPTNLLMGRNGLVKIIDFGIAKSTANTLKTQTGIIRGTPAYMSPEQIQSKELDERSDLYALGVILYELCAGINPFANPDTFTTMIQVTQMPPPPLRQFAPDCPPSLEDLLAHLLLKNPEERPSDARVVYRQIEQILREHNYPHEQEDLADWLTIFRHSPPAAFNPFGFSADPRRTYLDSSSYHPPAVEPQNTVVSAQDTNERSTDERSTDERSTDERSTDERSTDEGHATTTVNPVIPPSSLANNLPLPPMLPPTKFPAQTAPSLLPHGHATPSASQSEQDNPQRTEKNSAQAAAPWLDDQGRVMIDRGATAQKREAWAELSSPAPTQTNIALMHGSPRDTIEQSEFFKLTMELGPKPPALVERGERLSVAPADAQLNAATLTNFPMVWVDDKGQVSVASQGQQTLAQQEEQRKKKSVPFSAPSDDELIALDELDLITATGLHATNSLEKNAQRAVLVEKKAVTPNPFGFHTATDIPSAQKAMDRELLLDLAKIPPLFFTESEDAQLSALAESEDARASVRANSEDAGSSARAESEDTGRSARVESERAGVHPVAESEDAGFFGRTESEERISPLFGMFGAQPNAAPEKAIAVEDATNKTVPEKKAVSEESIPSPPSTSSSPQQRETLGFGSSPTTNPLRATLEYHPNDERQTLEEDGFLSIETEAKQDQVSWNRELPNNKKICCKKTKRLVHPSFWMNTKALWWRTMKSRQESAQQDGAG